MTALKAPSLVLLTHASALHAASSIRAGSIANASAAWAAVPGYSGPNNGYWFIGDSGVATALFDAGPGCPATAAQAATYCSSDPVCRGFNVHAAWGGGCAQYFGGSSVKLSYKGDWTGYLKDPTSAPTSAPTPSPTSAPTSALAPASGAAGGASAVGDPHLQNVHGEKFDLMQPGNHLLINIPRKAAENALLRVDANAQRLGGQCTDLYFQELNITGAWANAKQSGGFHYKAQDAVGERSHWARFGRVQLKVAQGRTGKGTKYLNFYVKHLSRAGFSVGGLLGEDDHSLVETPLESCAHRLAL